jgi:hypothetical protein
VLCFLGGFKRLMVIAPADSESVVGPRQTHLRTGITLFLAFLSRILFSESELPPMLGWRLRGDSSEPLIAPPSSSAGVASLNGASNSSLIDAARAGSPSVLQDQTAKPSVQSLATGSDIIISKRSRARAGSSSPLEPTRRAAALSSQESRQHHPDRAHCMTCRSWPLPIGSL